VGEGMDDSVTFKVSRCTAWRSRAGARRLLPLHAGSFNGEEEHWILRSSVHDTTWPGPGHRQASQNAVLVRQLDTRYLLRYYVYVCGELTNGSIRSKGWMRCKGSITSLHYQPSLPASITQTTKPMEMRTPQNQIEARYPYTYC